MTQADLIKSRRSEPWRATLRKAIGNKERVSLSRTPMPALSHEQRLGSMYEEINWGFAPEDALAEARRCLDCPTPGCVEGCPAHIHIPSFIKNIERGELDEAIKIIRESSTLPSICSRVCPHENQCEGHCIYPVSLKKRAVAIGPLERYVADYERSKRAREGNELPPTPNGLRVAAIGSGPASLAFAHDMALLGYEVTIYEAIGEYGGVMRYGIPEFRLPSSILQDEVERLTTLGVRFVPNTTVGKDLSIEQLKTEGYSAIFIGIGATKAGYMGIPGEGLRGVMDSEEFLRWVNLSQQHLAPEGYLDFHGKHVAIIGGGNTAMDAVRVALRLGAERAMILYRRTRNEMPACLEEIEHALQEGAELLELHVPTEYKADAEGWVCSASVQQMELGDPDEKGRRAPHPIDGAVLDLRIDRVIVSIGSKPDIQFLPELPELEVERWGTIRTDESGQTSLSTILAGGDVVRGGATVVEAMVDGRRAARELHQKLQGDKISEGSIERP